MPTHRVLHVIPSLQWSPAERQLRIVLHYGSQAWQHRLCVVRNDPLPRFRSPQASVQQLGCADRLDLVGCQRLRAAIREFSPTIVHAWGSEAFNVVRTASAGLTCRWIGSEFERHGTQRHTNFRARLCSVCPQPAFWRGHRRLIPCWLRHEPAALHSPRGVLLMGYGVELVDDSTRRRTARHRLSERLQLPDEVKLVGFVGDFTVHQRLKDAIWAADLLKVVRDDVHLLLAGTGPHLWRLRRFRRQVRILDRVHFVHDPQSFDETLAALDICWVPGEYDLGTPLVIEAMAQGIPVIASDTPSHRRFVKPDITGALFEVGHRAGLARATNRLLNDRQRAESLTEAAQAQLAKHCSPTNVAAAYEQVYQSLAPAG